MDGISLGKRQQFAVPYLRPILQIYTSHTLLITTIYAGDF
jgi:hypothetical protein